MRRSGRSCAVITWSVVVDSPVQPGSRSQHSGSSAMTRRLSSIQAGAARVLHGDVILLRRGGRAPAAGRSSPTFRGRGACGSAALEAAGILGSHPGQPLTFGLVEGGRLPHWVLLHRSDVVDYPAGACFGAGPGGGVSHSRSTCRECVRRLPTPRRRSSDDATRGGRRCRPGLVALPLRRRRGWLRLLCRPASPGRRRPARSVAPWPAVRLRRLAPGLLCSQSGYVRLMRGCVLRKDPRRVRDRDAGFTFPVRADVDVSPASPRHQAG